MRGVVTPPRTNHAAGMPAAVGANTMQQLTFWDVQKNDELRRDSALRIAMNTARKFAKSHYTSILSVADYESEAAAATLEYLQQADFNIKLVAQRVKFHLLHTLEKVDRNIQRARQNRATLVDVGSQKTAEAFAEAPAEIPLAVAVEIGEILTTFPPPVAAAIADIMNGKNKDDSARRNKISNQTLYKYLDVFKKKLENVL